MYRVYREIYYLTGWQWAMNAYFRMVDEMYDLPDRQVGFSD